MSNEFQAVQAHYGAGGLLQRIEDALRNSGIDPLRPKCEDLYAFDQLHSRGITATMEHAEHAGLTGDMHVLEIGCGVGGCSRYLASAIGCQVTATDLTLEYIEVSRELNVRCGLASKITAQQANALDLPFPDGTFDHVWSHNVTMNVADKARLAAEVARVLKPGGRFSCSEMAQGMRGAPDYPLPWATDPAYSFLVTPEEMRSTFEAAGLRVLTQIDLTERNVVYARDNLERAKRGEPPSQDNRPVMGEAFALHVRNAGKGAVEGKLVEHLIVTQKV